MNIPLALGEWVTKNCSWLLHERLSIRLSGLLRQEPSSWDKVHGASCLNWLERGFTDQKVRRSNPTSASRLPLSRLGQSSSIPALAEIVKPSVMDSHCESSSDEDTSSSELEAPPPPRPVEKKKPPLFTVFPDYVPKIPERVSPRCQLEPLGKVTSVVDGCVIIQADASAPVMDTGSALFLEGGEPLGEVYETFGPVSKPRYIVVLPNSLCLINTNTSKSRGKSHRRRHPVTEVVVLDSDLEQEAQTTGSSPNLPTNQANDTTMDENLSSVTDLLERNPCDASLHEGMQLCANTNDTPGDHDDIPAKGLQQCPDNNLTLDGSNNITSTDNCSPDACIDAACPSVSVEDTVYYVKDNPELSIPVFYSQLVQMKGSDASWVGDTEPPPEELEFSDDEQERLHKRAVRAKRRMPATENDTTAAIATSASQTQANRLTRKSRPTRPANKGFPAGRNSTISERSSNAVTGSPEFSPVFQPFGVHAPPFTAPLPSQPFFSPASVSFNQPPSLPPFSQPGPFSASQSCSPPFCSRPASAYVQTSPRPFTAWPRFSPDSMGAIQSLDVAADWPLSAYRNPVMISPPLWFGQVRTEYPISATTHGIQSVTQASHNAPSQWTLPPPAFARHSFSTDSLSFFPLNV
ncbi:hypothetical protein T265_00226 [Opisthorchis viverrini]|uniref:H/ACA ribonucleoprotein complex non-core subunit NAF1 n=1 Tax=Opisthorchis viverrini TaxID=6198 RepID=A0A075A6P3_OPIVI|nr:hypothetical protein T265_00226 [Opisthorchis viverrini]KER34042.1 hypothetical protein T265_00226 [Opisthorchis viverrini]